MKKEVIGYTKSGKAVYNTKSSKGFDLQDLLDARQITNELERCALRSMRLFQEDNPYGHNLIVTNQVEFDKAKRLWSLYIDLNDYFYRKYKALQNGTKTYREPSFERNH